MRSFTCGKFSTAVRLSVTGAMAALAVVATSAGVVSAAGPAVAVATSVEQIRPTDGTAGRPTSATLVAARNEFESVQLVVQGPATGVSVTGNLFGWNTTQLSAVRYVSVVEPSDAEGGVGLWGDVLVPEVDQMFGENRNAFPFDVPAGENRVVWVDVFVPLGTAPGVYSGSLAVTSTGGTTAVPVSMEVLDLDLPSTPSLGSAFYMTRNGGLCNVHGCAGNAAAKNQLYSMYSRLALENRMTIVNGSGLDNGSSPANYSSAADWEAMYEAPIIRGTGPTFPPPLRGGWRGPDRRPWEPSTTARSTVSRHAWTSGKRKRTRVVRTSRSEFIQYACDEPNDSAALWQNCAIENDKARLGWVTPGLVTATLRQYNARAGAAGLDGVSHLVPPLNRIFDKAGV